MKERTRKLSLGEEYPNTRGKRPASYVAFTCEDPLTHEVSVLLGEVVPPRGQTKQVLPRYGLPGGGQKRGWEVKRKRNIPIGLRRSAEDPYTVAIRETKEETGIVLEKDQLQLALAVEQKNPLYQGRRWQKPLKRMRKNTKPKQLSFVFIPTGDNLPDRCDIQGRETWEMKNFRWFTVNEAQKAREHHDVFMTDEVLEGMQIASEWHKLHISTYPFDDSHFRMLLDPKNPTDAELLQQLRQLRQIK